MPITNHERVGKAMKLLKSGLGPFVEREFKSAYKDRAAAQTCRFMGEDRLNAKRSLAGTDTLTSDGPAHVVVWAMKPIFYAFHR
jgi:hypothetical protein